MPKKAMIRLDKINGYPVSFYNSVEGLENGQFVSLKGLYGTDREAYNIEVATKTSTGMLALHGSVPMLYDERLMEYDFCLAQGKIGRAFVLERGDIFTIANTFGTGAIAKGDKLGIDATGKLAVAETVKVVEVLALEKFSGQDSLVLQYL